MREISFEVGRIESSFITKIVERAAKIIAGIDQLSLSMDLTACHANGCKLNLVKLYQAPDFDFVHDIGGIMLHMDRSTGQLRDFFLPRCAMPEEAMDF